MSALPTDPAELKKALAEARREKGRLNREGEPTDEIKARIAELEAAIESAATGAVLGAVGGDAGTAVALRGEDVVGVVAVKLAPGVSKVERTKAIDDALTPHLSKVAEEASVVLAADAHKFTRERPGRDGEGRTVLDVRGRIEGDRIVPNLAQLKTR
ncbi:MAG: hypothetical protein U0414_23255 [Polyangiaceae bacterium]